MTRVLVLFLVALLKFVVSQNQTTAKYESENVTTVETQRITQPSAQTQQIERTVEPSVSERSVEPSVSNTTRFSDFKPSPPLENYYEFNKFPVPPAFPEAKHISNLNLGEIPANVKWPERSFTTTEQPPWSIPVRFPTSRERPYEFYNQDRAIFTTTKPYNFPQRPPSDYGIAKQPIAYGPIPKSPTNWDKFEKEEEKRQYQVYKNQFDFTATVPGKQHYEHYELAQQQPHQEVEKKDPWKKVIKFLTAVIPIGLLLSALTPTVITVTNVNGTTHSRSRAEDVVNQNPKPQIFDKIGKGGCDDRILCEILVSASNTKNAEHHVNNFLKAFVENGKAAERADELKKVFAAVRKQDCRPIVCSNIDEET